MSFFCRMAGCSHREGEKLDHSRGARSRAAAPSPLENSGEVGQASVLDAPWTPPDGGVPGMFN